MNSDQNNDYKENNNKEEINDNQMNEEAEDTIKVDRQQLIKQLNILEISTESLYIILIATILNIKFIGWNKIRVFDALNSTNYSENLEDLTYVPKLVNKMYLFTTIIFLFIIYDSYETAINASAEQIDEQLISDTGSNLLAIILIFFGTIINFRTLNRT